MNSFEITPFEESLDSSQPTGWESVAAMANQYPKQIQQNGQSDYIFLPYRFLFFRFQEVLRFRL